MTTLSMPRAWRARLDALGVAITPDRRRAIRDGLIVAGILFNSTLLLAWGPRLYWFIDAQAWARIDLHDLYGTGMGDPQLIGAFRYAPVIAWLFLPATWVPWPVLVAGYVGLSMLALVALTGRRAPLFLIAFPPVLLELVNGNIHLFIALAIWAGMRRPAAWAFVLLTKVTPGIGLLWFVARREWRSLATALGATAVIVAVSVALAPQTWLEWLRSLVSFAGAQEPTAVPPLWVRLPFAGALALWAGRTDRAWLVPIAAFLALPVLWLQGLAILTASFPLYWERARWQRPNRAGPINAAALEAVPA
jgi:hypothetical protein